MPRITEMPTIPQVGEYVRTVRERNGLPAGMEGKLIGIQADSFCMIAFEPNAHASLHACWTGGTEESSARQFNLDPNEKRYYFCYVGDVIQVSLNGKRIKIKSKTCAKCGRIIEGSRYNKTSDGKLVCPDCMDIKSYSTKNNEAFGKETKKGYTYGFEFECVPKNDVCKADMVASKYHLIPTSDASLNEVRGIEFKSPTLQSKRCLKPMLNFVYDKAKLSSACCGQHINMGNKVWLDRDAMELIRSKADYLFLPLEDYMDNHPDEQKKLCGRTYSQYCTHSNGVWRHGRWLNLDHDNRFEFRIAKFVTPEQYATQVDMWEDVMEVVHTAVTHHPRQNRQWKAYGNKIVDVFKEYAAKV